MATTKSTAPKTTSKAATKSTKKAKPASKATSGGKTSTSKKAAKPSVSTTKRAAASKTAAKKSTAKKAVPKPTASKKATAKKVAAKTPAAKKGAKKTTTGKKAASKKTATAEPVASKTTATTKSVGTKQPAKAKEASRPKTKSASKAKKAKPVFDKKFLDQQVKLLKLEREKYLNSSVSLESEAQQLLETREQGDVQFDEESAEGDSWAIVREQDLALSADARATVEKIDQALLRIKDGTYGICERTGKPIPRARLKAIPWATETVGKKTHGLLLR